MRDVLVCTGEPGDMQLLVTSMREVLVTKACTGEQAGDMELLIPVLEEL